MKSPDVVRLFFLFSKYNREDKGELEREKNIQLCISVPKAPRQSFPVQVFAPFATKLNARSLLAAAELFAPQKFETRVRKREVEIPVVERVQVACVAVTDARKVEMRTRRDEGSIMVVI